MHCRRWRVRGWGLPACQPSPWVSQFLLGFFGEAAPSASACNGPPWYGHGSVGVAPSGYGFGSGTRVRLRCDESPRGRIDSTSLSASRGLAVEWGLIRAPDGSVPVPGIERVVLLWARRCSLGTARVRAGSSVLRDWIICRGGEARVEACARARAVHPRGEFVPRSAG